MCWKKERERIITAAWVSLKHWQHGNVRLQFAFHVSYPARLNSWWSRLMEEMLMLCSFWMEISVQLLSGLRFWLNFVPFDSSFTRNFLCQLCSSCCCLPQFHVSITVIKLSSGEPNAVPCHLYVMFQIEFILLVTNSRGFISFLWWWLKESIFDAMEASFKAGVLPKLCNLRRIQNGLLMKRMRRLKMLLPEVFQIGLPWNWGELNCGP